MIGRRSILATSALVLGACGDSGTSSSTGSGGQPAGTATSGSTTTATSVSSSTGATSTGTGTGGGPPVGTPRAYVGSGDGKIRVYDVDIATGALTLTDTTDAGSNPSFLAFDATQSHLYAADEGQSELESFAIDPSDGHLTFIDSVSSSGNGPAHVAVAGSYVFGVNYGSGNLTMVATNPDGSFGAATSLATGANAHQIVVDATKGFAFVPNKGTDKVSQLVLDVNAGTIVPNTPATVSLPAGSGPRHMVFHPTLPVAYVVHENDDRVSVFAYDGASGKLGTIAQSISTLPSGANGAMNTCAEIAVAKDGAVLYASNRGHDSIAVFTVDPGTGMLALVDNQPTGGSTPRHFSIEPSGQLMLVGNQGSDSVVTFRIDAAGMLEELLTTAVPGGPEFVGVIYQ